MASVFKYQYHRWWYDTLVKSKYIRWDKTTVRSPYIVYVRNNNSPTMSHDDSSMLFSLMFTYHLVHSRTFWSVGAQVYTSISLLPHCRGNQSNQPRIYPTIRRLSSLIQCSLRLLLSPFLSLFASHRSREIHYLWAALRKLEHSIAHSQTFPRVLAGTWFPSTYVQSSRRPVQYERTCNLWASLSYHISCESHLILLNGYGLRLFPELC